MHGRQKVCWHGVRETGFVKGSVQMGHSDSLVVLVGTSPYVKKWERVCCCIVLRDLVVVLAVRAIGFWELGMES